MSDETEIPSDLLDPPAGQPPPPPVQTAEQVLPIGALATENFERLCLRPASLEGSPHRSRRYGTTGQTQYGIDIYSRLPSGRYATYQCKRYAHLQPSDIVDAVDLFMKGTWATRSDRFVFCTSTSADRTELEEEIEDQTEALHTLKPPVAFEIWDEEAISDRLRGFPEIVDQFFGPHWARRCYGQGDLATGTPQEITAIIRAAVADSHAPQVISLDWAPESLRSRLADLRKSDPENFRRLSEHFGDPPQAALVAAATTAPPPWLAVADATTWDLLARIAQALGEWPAAMRAWTRVADHTRGKAGASALVSAAVAARTGGDDIAHDKLISQADAADPRNPRVVLARMGEHAPPSEQFALLADLHSDDPEELGLLAAKRAVLHLLSSDIAAARDCLRDVRLHMPGSAVVDGLDISITVQEGRLAVIGHRVLDRGSLLGAANLAIESRERLLRQSRFSEATRLVMLRADIYALLGDRGRASAVIREATPDERTTQEQKEILAEWAAGRALDPELALELLEGAAPTPAVRRIRFECMERVGTPAERLDALAGLDALVAEDGPEASVAAFLRLAACLSERPTAWSDAAGAYLRLHGHEGAAVTAEAIYRVAREGWEPVERLLRPYGTTPWAVATRLRAAMHPRVDRQIAIDMADAALDIGPSHALRVDAGRALSHGRDFKSARQVLIAVARDPNAPDVSRADAYDLLMKVVGVELGNWPAAGDLHDAWTALMPADTRAQAWAPRVANRRGAQP